MANKKFVAKNGIAVGTGHTTTDVIDQDGHITANTVTISGTLLNATAFAGTANNASYLEGSNGSYYTGYADNKAANAYSNATSYADNKAANAYSNAIAYSANATNISSGTLTANVLPTSGVTAATYGNSSSIPVITIDATGRITSATTNAVAGVTGFTYTPSNATFIITTGAGSTFPASISSANDSVAGIVKVLDSVSNTDIYIAASANSVKTAYDNATTAYSNAATYADNKAANAYSNATSYAATIAGTAYSNATTFASSAAATAYSNAVSAASSSAATAYSNATTFAANATNISSGTLAELRLPFRMDQNVRTNDTVSFGNMTITGNLTVTGTTVTVNANNLSIQDNMIYLNSNSSITNPDLGIAGNYNDGTYRHAGFFRDASDGVWKVFDQYLPEPDASPYIDTANASFRIANFQANVVTAASFSGNGASVTSVNAATVGSNTAGTLRSYSDSTAATAYSNATSYAATIAGTAYTNATSFASSAAATAYSNAVSAASSSAATAYSNAVSYAASIAGTAYSNATSYAATIAGTAYSNAVSYFTTNSAIGIKYDLNINVDLNGTGTTNALTSFNAYFPSGGGYNQPVGGGQHFRILQFGRYNSSDSNYWRGQIAQSFYEDRMWFRKEYSQTWGSWQELWHTGNDGSGSGLDADTLDGQQGSYYAVDADVVKLTGTQTITGTKTFSGAASAPFRLLATNANAGWDAVTFQATTEWGDATVYGVLGGDGTEGIMLRRPHVVWSGDHASADIRLGRSGGTSGGAWVNYGIKASNVGFIGYENTNVLTFSGASSRITAVNGVDAPIFYDSNDTAYYTNPASTSVLNTIYGNEIRARKSQTAGNYTTATLWTESYDNTTTGIAFHISGNVGKFLEMRTNGILYWNGDTVWHSGNDGSGSGLDADLLDGYSSSSFSGPNSTIKQFFWNDLTASGTQARRFEIARIAVDYNDWNTGIGAFEVELWEGYYSRGLKKKYVVYWGYVNTYGINLVEYVGSGDNNFQCTIGTPVLQSGDNYYLPVYVDVNYYSHVDVRVTTNRDITGSSSPGIGQTYINLSPSPTNISSFSPDSTVNFTSTSSVQINGNTLWHAGNDGAGSGLDADLLDGLSSGSFIRSDADTGVTQTYGPRFGHTNQTDSNDGFIAAGKFGTGLNIVGTQTSAGTGRQVRIWGSVIDSGGSAYWYAGNDGSGSGLDADLLDGLNSNSFLRGAGNVTAVDFNTLNYNSMYVSYIDSSPNKPTNYAYPYGVILTFDPDVGSAGRAQFYVSHAGNDLCFRGGWNGNDSWQTWNRVWTNQNDGSGSGLDADLWDGYQFADYLNQAVKTNSAPQFAKVRISDSGTSYFSGLQNGALYLGNISNNYKYTSGWSGSMQGGILADCADNWEFVVHDAGDALASAFCYNGGASNRNFEIGRDLGWGTMYTTLHQSARSPIFYDSNDTGYYIDPNSTSNSALRVRGGALYGPNVTWGAYLYVGTDGRVGSSATVAVTNGNLHMDCQNGYAMYLNWYSNNNIYSGTGNFGIGSDVASYKLHVHGAIYATGNITAYSDARIKKNIVTVDDAIQKVKNLRGVYYERTDDEEKIRYIGVIAQEVKEVLPEVVSHAKEIDQYSVAYGNMVGLLIEAIKEQQKQIEELKAALLNK